MALGFFSSEDTLTPESIQRRRAMADALLKQSTDTAPIKSWTQGAARLVQALSGTIQNNRLDEADKANQAYSSQQLAKLLGGGGDSSPVSSGSPMPLSGATAPTPASPSPAAPASTGGGDPRGIRNNNPGNIEDGNFARSIPGYAGSDGRFARFESPEGGFQAQSKLLDTYQNKHGLNTVAGIVGRWAPAGDGNNVSAYAQSVAKQMGVDPNAPLDLSDPKVKSALMAGMIQHENGRNPYGTQRIMASIGGGGQPAPAPMPQQALPGGAMAFTAAGQPVPTDAQGNALQPNGMPTSTPPVPPQTVPPRPAPSPQQLAQAVQAPVAPQAAPGGQGSAQQRQALAAAIMSDPRASPAVKQVAGAILTQSLGPQYDFQAVGDQFYRVNKRTGTYEPIAGVSKPTYGVTGEDANGNKTYGFIDTGSKTITPGPSSGPSGSKIGRETADREAEATRMGLDPKDSRTKQFILTGNYPKEPELTTTDKTAILEADEMVSANRATIGSLEKAKQLSKEAWGWAGAGTAATVLSPLGNQTAQKTQELNQVVTEQALAGLKSTFGGNPTEGERKILLDIQGSASLPDAVRQKIFDRAIVAANRRMQFNEDRAKQLRGGSFYKPNALATPAPFGLSAPPPQQPKADDGWQEIDGIRIRKMN